MQQTSAPELASEQAYRAIIDLILGQGLRPGERTSANALSARLGIGRTPVKEAITRLEAEGVLDVAGRSGTTLKAIDASEIRHLFALRRVLEDFAAEGAAACVRDVDLAALALHLDRMRWASRDGIRDARASTAFLKANVAFHALIIRAAGNPFLDRLYAQLQIPMQIVTYLMRGGANPEAALRRQREHDAIFAALEARDADELKRLLAIHAETTERAILNSLADTTLRERPGPGHRASKERARRR